MSRAASPWQMAPKLFDAGHIMRAPGALLALARARGSEHDLLQRHQRGDYGDVTRVDRAANALAIAQQARVHSAYAVAPGAWIWIITDIGRRLTTVMLPSEFAARFPDDICSSGARR